MSSSLANVHLRRTLKAKEQEPIHLSEDSKINRNQSIVSLKLIMTLLIFGFCCALLVVILTRYASSTSSSSQEVTEKPSATMSTAETNLPSSHPIKENTEQAPKNTAYKGLEKNTHAPDETTKHSKTSLQQKDSSKAVSSGDVAKTSSTIKSDKSKNGKINASLTQQKKMNRIAPLFIAHGAPTLAIELDHAMNKFLGTKLAKQYKGQDAPKAVVVFTAHWEDSIANNGVAITFHDSNTVYETIYDFYGFPDEMYTLKYPAKGAPQVAQRIEQLLNQNNIKSRREYKRGLDHGTWVVLKTLFPGANIPVVQCSVDARSSIETHYNIGKALAPLANEQVLVIGSGSTVHNLGRVSWGKTTPDAWAVEFDDWLIDRIAKWNTQELFSYEKFAPNARTAVPRSEHFVPVFVAMGMAHEEKTSKVIERFYDFGSLSYLSFSF